MQKKEARKYFSNLRSTSKTVDPNLFVQQIKTLNIDWKDKYVHIFLPITEKKEIDTFPIIQFLREEGAKICIPKAEFESAQMEAFIYEQNDTLIKNQWNIPEPSESAKLIEPQKIDIIFVPLLCFDLKGYRVGYGKGFYDRYIARTNNPLTIGLSQFEAIEAIQDIDQYDQPLDRAITPTQSIQFTY